MYQIGAFIVYGKEGVCRVEAIGMPEISGVGRDRLYYTLKPLYRDGVIYTPADTAVFMRPVISGEEATELIQSIPTIEPCPCREGSVRLLTEHYEKFLHSHSCADLVQLIRTVDFKEQEAQRSNKKLGMIDMRFMNRAEELLYGELAVVLGMEKSTVKEYIFGGAEPTAEQKSVG